ncbi:uncharacterized protein PAN0_021d6002 [Moesziomyces antarcticus]|uniref:Uncharacterized protein n=2 Tax=Pseudozyma antarctica TaxID=84753 RepID=A0A081CM77_PSEA2|nr:uncharacterized protein PAN0_021d6002 [Moesziomyces antarcticus]GAK67773.1 hypothetical protein PAN0_021d6002 [Moesziomyces antarcticus]SPO48991.1 uncharacterized protein PSANT_06682 [Moesziomyces antarcticus]
MAATVQQATGSRNRISIISSSSSTAISSPPSFGDFWIVGAGLTVVLRSGSVCCASQIVPAAAAASAAAFAPGTSEIKRKTETFGNNSKPLSSLSCAGMPLDPSQAQ